MVQSDWRAKNPLVNEWVVKRKRVYTLRLGEPACRGNATEAQADQEHRTASVRSGAGGKIRFVSGIETAHCEPCFRGDFRKVISIIEKHKTTTERRGDVTTLKDLTIIVSIIVIKAGFIDEHDVLVAGGESQVRGNCESRIAAAGNGGLKTALVEDGAVGTASIPTHDKELKIRRRSSRVCKIEGPVIQNIVGRSRKRLPVRSRVRVAESTEGIQD